MFTDQIQSLNNKVVLVTAAGSGIGRVIAESFLAQGAKVLVCDLSKSVLDEFRSSTVGVTTSLCDVSDTEQVKKMFGDIQLLYGRLDVVVNNAGIAGPTAAVEDIDPAEWEQTLAVDLTGTFLVTRLAVPMLKKSEGGSIINMSSNAGLSGCPMRSPYVASKWAIIGLTKTWAMELGPFNIRVNAICPGSVDGPRIDAVIERDAASRDRSAEEVRDVYQRQSSLRTFVSAEDVANMALFIASDLGARVSGQSLSVDGNTESLANWLD